MKILITGHRGFIGSALVLALSQQETKCEIIGVSRSTGKNLLDSSVLNGLPKVDKIIHLAGTIGVSHSWQFPGETYQNNLLPMLNILEFARPDKTPIIYMSSYVYGIPKYLPIDEDHPIDCVNPYAHSKRQAEILCEAYFRDFGVPITILRPFNLYGTGQNQESLIPHIVTQAVNSNSIQVKSLNPKRDYLHIDDLVKALLKVIDSKQVKLEIYNLGYGLSYSVQEIINLVLKELGKELPVFSSEEPRPNEIMDCYSNSQRFSMQFTWQPQIPLIEGISQLLQTVKKIHDERS